MNHTFLPPPPDPRDIADPLLIRMTPAQVDAALADHRLAEDVARLRGRIEQMAFLGPGATIRLRDGRIFPVPPDLVARRQLAAMVTLIEVKNFLGAHGLDPKGVRLLSQMAMALADHARGVANPLLAIATRIDDDGNSVRRRAPDRVDEDLAIGAAAAAIYRRGQAGQSHQAAAGEVAALLDRIGLETPSAARRGKDDAGTADPHNRRWTGPRLLSVFYQVQRHRIAADKGQLKNAATRRARFFAIALHDTAAITNHSEAAAMIEGEIVRRLSAETL